MIGRKIKIVLYSGALGKRIEDKDAEKGQGFYHDFFRFFVNKENIYDDKSIKSRNGKNWSQNATDLLSSYQNAKPVHQNVKKNSTSGSIPFVFIFIRAFSLWHGLCGRSIDHFGMN
jgi:hypothetical protein